MAKFGASSSARLETAHPDLQRLFKEVVKKYDCSILCGKRNEEEQNELFKSKKSKVKYPNSKHNPSPAMAVDVAPWPISWSDMSRFYHFAGYVQCTADNLGIKIRFGGDWDGDYRFDDQTFLDLVHFELVTTDD